VRTERETDNTQHDYGTATTVRSIGDCNLREGRLWRNFGWQLERDAR
jgi:hypothetical protein